MTLLVAPDALAARRALLTDPDAPLGRLARSLQRELHDALDVPVPSGKARLTRRGGRCPACTVLLVFDPRDDRHHRCPQCGGVFADDVHREYRLLWAHEWAIEQAVRGAALAALLGDAVAGARADAILATYADTYLDHPNADNVLGPTRLFFSSYLESIWLLNASVALDLREAAGTLAPALAARVRERIVAPSVALVASYDEGRSNRQAWRAAALLAAGGVLGDEALRDAGANALAALARDALLDDGSWYEGENYHLFAHRGLATALALAERCGRAPLASLVARIERGWSAPFATMLPDGTFPARRDSQYGVSLVQWRTADWLECGLTRRPDDAHIRAALAACYAPDLPDGETGRATSAADAERNHPPVRLGRADLGWRALLFALPELPPLDITRPASVLLPRQGLGIVRRDAGRWYVALDYGETGGGHGHPDRLNLLVATPRARWLDDMGTGSYTDPSLAWYRSSLAHAAPFVGDGDQPEAPGTLIAWEERGGAGWIEASWHDPVHDTTIVRTVVVMDAHVVDRVRWHAPSPRVVTLPLPVHVATDDAWHPFDGAPPAMLAWLGAPSSRALAAGATWRTVARGVAAPHAVDLAADDVAFDLAIVSTDDALLWRADTPGPPGGRAHATLALRQDGTAGESWRVLAPVGAVRHVALDGTTLVVEGRDGTTHRHERVAHGWLVTLLAGGARSSIDLAGLVTTPDAATHAPREPASPAPEPVATIGGGRAPRTFVLGEAAWRRGDRAWPDEGAPSAMLHVDAQPATLVVGVQVTLGRPPEPTPAVAENPLDNEHPDTNADGVELHYADPVTDDWCTLLAVPEHDGTLRLTTRGASDRNPIGRWHATSTGWIASLVLDWPTDRAATVTLDACVNVRPPGRERRVGQLVASGGRGEWIYLRGDRQPRDRALVLRLDPTTS
jgi:hypothetical protein